MVESGHFIGMPSASIGAASMEAHLATVSIPGGLAWQPLMDAIGDQLLAGFGRFENLGQLEEALSIALERDGPTEIVHAGALALTGEQLGSYLGVLASVAEEAPLKVSFVDGAVGALLPRHQERD
jgi:hypothetical protein